MTWFKVKINFNDRKFSEYIRTRDGWKCQYKFRCNGVLDYSDNRGALHCSHFQKRGKWTTRYDPDNCDAVCVPCHFFVENDSQGQKTLEEWKEKQLGEQRYKALLIRANTTGRRDDKLTAIYIKQLWDSMERQRGTNKSPTSRKLRQPTQRT